MRDTITYLFKYYVQVEYHDFMRNHSKLSEPWDANQTFQEFVKHVQEIQYFANDGGRKISDKDIDDTICTVV